MGVYENRKTGNDERFPIFSNNLGCHRDHIDLVIDLIKMQWGIDVVYEPNDYTDPITYHRNGKFYADVRNLNPLEIEGLHWMINGMLGMEESWKS